MFLSYYGFQEQPFGTTPDLKYLYWTPSHREALSSLYYGIKTDRGFITLFAPPGYGKTSIIFHLLEVLKKTHRTVFLFQTINTPTQLLRLMMADLGYGSGTRDPVVLQTKLNRILLELADAGKQLILVIDEAQNLSSACLEAIRLLSNFEKPGCKLIQVILSGQNQLEEKLAQPDLEQFRQRISMTARLSPLAQPEIIEYIRHRFSVAGCRSPFPFESEALDCIAESSGGVPRVINNLCFQALSLGFVQKTRKIGIPIMREVLADMHLTAPSIQQAGLTDSTDADTVVVPAVGDSGTSRFISPAAVKKKLLKILSRCFRPGKPGKPDRPDRPDRSGRPDRPGRAGPLVQWRKHLWQEHWIEVILFAGLFIGGLSTGLFLVYSDSPADTLSPAPATSSPQNLTITVQPDETLIDIILNHTGRYPGPELLKAILDMNPQIKDPDRLRPGELIRLPDDLGARTATSNQSRSNNGVRNNIPKGSVNQE